MTAEDAAAMIRAGEDEAFLRRISMVRSRTMKDFYVFTMAMAQLKRGHGARTRAVNAARRIDATLREVYGNDSQSA